MQTYRIPNLVPGPIKTRIGEVCVQWSILELQVERLIWHLSGVGPKEGRLITAKEDITPRLKRLKKLAAEKLIATEAEEIRKLAGDIKEAKKDRHRVVHGLYGVDAHNAFHAINYREKAPKGLAHPVTDAYLRGISTTIRELTRRADGFIPQ